VDLEFSQEGAKIFLTIQRAISAVEERWEKAGKK
jgi:hypothetical protein